MALLSKLLPSEIRAEVSADVASSVLPDGLVLMPKNFSNRVEWDSFSDQAKRQPGAIVVSGGVPVPPGFTGNVFPIAWRVAGGWVIGGLPNPDELFFYDLNFDVYPEPLP
jgi:hypothetical protein